MFAGGSRKAVSENKSGEKKISGNRVEDEAIKIDIIINKLSLEDSQLLYKLIRSIDYYIF